MTEAHQCSGLIHGLVRDYSCRNPGRMNENGRWWCGVHAPSTKARKDAKVAARWDAKAKARDQLNEVSYAKDEVVDAAVDWVKEGGPRRVLRLSRAVRRLEKARGW